MSSDHLDETSGLVIMESFQPTWPPENLHLHLHDPEQGSFLPFWAMLTRFAWSCSLAGRIPG
jgi:hypothetical protein